MASRESARHTEHLSEWRREGPQEVSQVVQVPGKSMEELAARVALLENQMENTNVLHAALKACIDAQRDHIRTQAKNWEALEERVKSLTNVMYPFPTGGGRGRSRTRYSYSRASDSRSPNSRSRSPNSRRRSRSPGNRESRQRSRSHSRSASPGMDQEFAKEYQPAGKKTKKQKKQEEKKRQAVLRPEDQKPKKLGEWNAFVGAIKKKIRANTESGKCSRIEEMKALCGVSTGCRTDMALCSRLYNHLETIKTSRLQSAEDVRNMSDEGMAQHAERLADKAWTHDFVTEPIPAEVLATDTPQLPTEPAAQKPAADPAVKEVSVEASLQEQAKQAALDAQAKAAEKQVAISSSHYEGAAEEPVAGGQQAGAAGKHLETQGADIEEQPTNSQPSVVQTFRYYGCD